VEQLYKKIGQSAVLEKFKASTANALLPVNYNVGGRRKTRNKRRKNKNKSRRTR
jgi:hypothetical protein